MKRFLYEFLNLNDLNNKIYKIPIISNYLFLYKILNVQNLQCRYLYYIIYYYNITQFDKTSKFILYSVIINIYILSNCKTVFILFFFKLIKFVINVYNNNSLISSLFNNVDIRAFFAVDTIFNSQIYIYIILYNATLNVNQFYVHFIVYQYIT